MRQSWDDYFFALAKLVSTRSTCLRRQYGAVLVKDKHNISGGFNGAPRGCQHCEDIGCAREVYESGTHHELCRAVHAEQNCIANAARFGINTEGSELYLYPGDIPCPLCAKLLINAGISVVHYTSLGYPGYELSIKYFDEAKVRLVRH